MKKILLVLMIPSMLLVACGDGKEKENVEIVEMESSTTTTTEIIQETPPVEENPVIQETPTEVPQSSGTPAKTAPKPAAQSGSGGVIGHISIPSIGVERDIREGIDIPILNKSPGHYSHSPKPCRAGNAAIAGHRTTYGAPFNKLDLLKNGDLIFITTPEGDCTYKYLRTEIVKPNNVAVVMPKDGNANLLTLTACHPKGSAAQRIVVTSTLVSVTLK